MVSAAIARGTGAVGSGAHPFSLLIDGNDLVNYVDWHTIRVSMSARIEDSSSMTFTVHNHDGSLDFHDFWGGPGPGSYYAWPLREVQFFDNNNDEALFGGYITNLRIRHAYPDRNYIDVTCVGYSWLLDACVLTEDATFVVGTTGGIQRAVSLCGLPGGVTAASGFSNDISDPGNPGIKFTDSITGATGNDLVVTAGTTLRGTIAQIASRCELPIICYIDNYKRLCITDTLIGTTFVAQTFHPTSYPAESLDFEFEFSEYVSHVYIKSTDADGTGWYMAKEVPGWGNELLDDTYLSVPVAAYVNDDDSTSALDIELDGRNYVARTQSGIAPQARVTKTGDYRRLAQRFGIEYPQFGPTSQDESFALTHYTMTFLRPDQPVLDMRLSHYSDLGSGGRVRSNETGPDADQFPSPPRTRTTAEARRRKHKRRKR